MNDAAQQPAKSKALVGVLAVLGTSCLFLWLSWYLGPNTKAGGMAALGGTLGCLTVALVCQRWLGLPLSEIGFKRPASWTKAILLGIAVAIVTGGLVQGAMLLINPLVNAEPPDISRFNRVRGNLGVLLTTVPTVWLTSAFPEEVIWRGFLTTRVAKLIGATKAAWGTALVLTSFHFGLIHFYQGPSGMVVTGVAGLFYGLAFLIFRRNLWIPIFAHAANHVISFTAMYLGAV